MKLVEKLNEKLSKFVEKADRNDVFSATKKAADEIHGEADEKILNSMIDNALKLDKNTEDTIQVVINMLRSRK